jgi:hypothetical protein
VSATKHLSEREKNDRQIFPKYEANRPNFIGLNQYDRQGGQFKHVKSIGELLVSVFAPLEIVELPYSAKHV